MEQSNPNPFPEIEFTPRLNRVLRKVGRAVAHLFPEDAPLYMSNHYHGANGMLEHLSPSISCPDELEAPEQMVLNYSEAADELRQAM